MRTRCKGGFSLVEVLVVLAIVAAFALMIVPSLGIFLPSMRFGESCRQISSDIAMIRMRALERNETAGLSYDAATRTYTLSPYSITRKLPAEVVSATIPAFEFNSQGMLNSTSDVVVTLNGKGTRTRQMKISLAGRVRFLTP